LLERQGFVDPVVVTRPPPGDRQLELVRNCLGHAVVELGSKSITGRVLGRVGSARSIKKAAVLRVRRTEQLGRAAPFARERNYGLLGAR
jgi:hypothetical protein